MAKVIVDGASRDVPDGGPILEACEALGVPFGCRGGECATCVIVIKEGMENLEPRNSQEQAMELEDDERLACQARIRSGTVAASW